MGKGRDNNACGTPSIVPSGVVAAVNPGKLMRSIVSVCRFGGTT